MRPVGGGGICTFLSFRLYLISKQFASFPVSLLRRLPKAQPGYFPSDGDDTLFLTCPVEEACLGGDPFECAAEYEGRLCASCATLHYKKDNVCISCGCV